MLSDRILSHLQEVLTAPDLSGTRYCLRGELGRGGMGIVYLAEDMALGREVAIKVLPRGEEARTLAALEHPGIVPVHDAGTLPDGRAFYAMKRVIGVRLDEYRLTVTSVADRLRTFLRVCEPVAFAHSRGVIHRDLKPENVMIGSFGEVLVLDWGVAGRIEGAEQTAAGTTGYMAPEQVRGVTDERTDIYSLGKLLEYLLDAGDGKPIYTVAAKACSTEPEARYRSVVELMDDVERFIDHDRVIAYRESAWERAARWIARNRTYVVLVLTYVIARAVIFFLFRR